MIIAKALRQIDCDF